MLDLTNKSAEQLSDQEKPLLTKKALRELTGWSNFKIHTLQKSRKITFYKMGRNVYYKRSEIMESFQKFERKSS
jgi:hypothetical protein